MSLKIHAQLDANTASLRNELKKRLGWTDTEIIRRGINALSYLIVKNRKRKIVGLGQFASGIPDLGSNKNHFHGFGR